MQESNVAAHGQIIDLFAGPGGWSEALRGLGLAELGVEYDAAACATRAAAGHLTIQADIATLDPREVAPNGCSVLIASPPCQAFSAAGKKQGLLDERGRLIFSVLYWADALRPDVVILEQVPTVQPIWDTFATILQGWGYMTWTGVVHAEQYGVPQTRKRAILIASRHHQPRQPTPTHERYVKGKPRGGDLLLQPWVSMAEALGWGLVERPSTTVMSRDSGGGVRPLDGGSGSRAVYAAAMSTGRDWKPDGSSQMRPMDEPAPTISGVACQSRWVGLQPGSWADGRGGNRRIHGAEEPAPTLAFGKDPAGWRWLDRRNDQTSAVAEGEVDPLWPLDRPATTIAGRGLVGDPGANANRFNGATKSRNDGVQVTVAEAGVLQSFPADYPWQGTKTKQFQQVGNAVPPLLARAVLVEALQLQPADSTVD